LFPNSWNNSRSHFCDYDDARASEIDLLRFARLQYLVLSRQSHSYLRILVLILSSYLFASYPVVYNTCSVRSFNQSLSLVDKHCLMS
jgi:hypothetical protein